MMRVLDRARELLVLAGLTLGLVLVTVASAEGLRAILS
jgi:hypothetical protein